MAKNLGAAVIELLEHERAELRAAAAMVLAVVGKGDAAVVEGLTARLEDADGVVRRLALDGLAALGATGIAPRLVPLLRGDDAALAERAAQLLAAQGAGAEAALRKELGHGPVPARRAMAGLLLARGSAASVEAVLDQLADPEFGEQALQLLRAELDAGNARVIALVEEAAPRRAGEVGKRVQREWARAVKEAAKAGGGAAKAAAKDKAASKAKGSGAAAGKRTGAPGALLDPAAAPPPDPARDPAVAAAVYEQGLLLRLLGYQARPASLGLLIAHVGDDRPRSIRLAAVAAMRRLVAGSDARAIEKALETLIEVADDADPAVAQAAVDTLRGARIPEKLARPFAELARSRHPAAQKLAMERMPAGGGAGLVKALLEALAGAEPTARDAAARGLAKAPEAALAVARALVAAEDPEHARRLAGVLRAHKGNVSAAAVDALAEAAQAHLERHARGRADADGVLLERVLVEVLEHLAPARHVELLFAHARRLRKAGKPVEAFGALKPLLRGHAELDAAIDDDQRFVMATLGLEALGQAVLRASAGDAPVLEQFARLAARGYPVARKLAREKDVGDEDLYALGFRLVESKDDGDQELGAELLQGLIDERPRSKIARSARNKLKLAGRLDDD